MTVNDNSFFLRMHGDAMLDAGIYDNDLLRVTTNVAPQEGNLVLAMVAQDLVVRRYFVNMGQPVLMAENVNYPAILINDHEVYEICGVVEKI